MMFIALLLASAMLASGSTPVMAEEPLDNQALRFVVKNESPIELRYRGIVEAGTLRPGDVVYIDPDGRKVFGYVEWIQIGMCPAEKAQAGSQPSLKIRSISPPLVGDVLVRVDEFYGDPAPPLPEEVEALFEFHVEDDFQLRGVGTVVLGIVRRGSLQVFDRVTVENPDGSGRQTMVTMIMKNREEIDRAEAGDTVGLALRGIDRDEVGRCSRVIIPGEEN